MMCRLMETTVVERVMQQIYDQPLANNVYDLKVCVLITIRIACVKLSCSLSDN